MMSYDHSDSICQNLFSSVIMLLKVPSGTQNQQERTWLSNTTATVSVNLFDRYFHTLLLLDPVKQEKLFTVSSTLIAFHNTFAVPDLDCF